MSVPTVRWDRLNFALEFKAFPCGSQLYPMHPQVCDILGTACCLDGMVLSLSQLTPISYWLVPTLGVAWEDMTSRLWHLKICPNSLPSLSAWSHPWVCLGKTWQAGCDISRSVQTRSHLSLPDPNIGCVLGRHGKQVMTFKNLSHLSLPDLNLGCVLGRHNKQVVTF